MDGSASHPTMAFVAPASSNILRSAGARRMNLTCRSAPRQAIVMKKVRRGATEDDTNAVDVFGSGLSQDELLASALGANDPEEPKKKKKPKKKSKIIESDDNAVDVFGASSLDPDELLAAAMGDSTDTAEAAPVQPKKSKKKKGKGKNVGNDNAVDVFAGANLTQEQLLAEALGETEPPKDTKKKNRKLEDGIDGSVEVHSSDDALQSNIPPVASETIQNGLDQTPTKKGKGKGKKKAKKSLISSSDENAVDVMGHTGLSQQELLESALGEKSPLSTVSGTELDPPTLSDDSNVTKEISEDTTSLDDEDDLNHSENPAEEEEDEDFEADANVVDEFQNFSSELASFTPKGRREQKKSERSERNESESKLADPQYANFGSGGGRFTSVRLEDVTMTFRNTTILDGVTWGVRTGERVGLIGENGSGKTTQLRIIAGLMEPTSGEVVTSSSNIKASFLRQEFVDELDPRRTLREEFYTAFTEESRLLAQYEKCERDISIAGEDLSQLERLLNQLEDLREKCEQKDAWNLDSRIDKVMPGLGFVEEDNDKLVASFSGGWKVRIGLGKVLMQDPDLLLLDEPSNHLDNESVEWLESFLQTCELPMVVVSHDREFLDRVCTKIVEIEGGEAFEYPGNYSRFVKLKKEQRKAWESAYERQQKFVKEQEQYIKQNRRNPARSSQVKSREKMLLRMERTGQMVRQPPRRGKPLVFRFPPAPRSGRDCILVDEVTHGYDGRQLLKDASIAIERGDRIALIGPNGCGKSTLLRMITGREKPQEGSVECQSLTNISLAYYEQNQADALDLDITVLDTLRSAAPSDMRYEEIRALLGKFLFKGDDVDKKVSALSGGEKARLALAKIMLEPANVLVLDEPGNHLSISAKEMLEEALQHFDGTLLLVSHDRYLISQVATQILAIEDKELVLYDGDYKSYMEKNDDLRQKLQARFIPGVAEIKNAPKIKETDLDVYVGKKQARKKNFGGSGINSGKTKEMNAKRWKK